MSKYLPWKLISCLVGSLVLFPIITLIALSMETSNSDTHIWSHLLSTVFSGYVLNSLTLMLGVAIVTLFLGVSSAWLVTQYDFIGSRYFQWALLLPLAMPTYITAYSYTGLLDVAGPLQNHFRELFDLQYGEYWFPEIRSMGGAIFVMSFVLYPYIYLLARASFLEQSQHLRDVGRLLGHSTKFAFFKITLPIARPAIIAGLSLVLMETLADFGAVSYFGVNTFTTGIFRTWYGLDSVSAAAQLSLVLLMFVVILMIVEKQSRRRLKYHGLSLKKINQKKPLTKSKSVIAYILCSVPIVLGFIIPNAQLFIWSLESYTQIFDSNFWVLIKNTLSLAAATSTIALVLALLVAYSNRIVNNKVTRASNRIIGLGYAVPGLVIAVGTLIPLAKLDNNIDHWFRQHFDYSTGLILSGTLTALIIAYLVRFLSVALRTVDSGLQSVDTKMEQSARSLGTKPFYILKKIHLPIIKSSALTALLIVFVDVMKELPATLILQPFNFNTLAVRAYELASDERLSDASMPSLAIVLVGLLPVILLSKSINK